MAEDCCSFQLIRGDGVFNMEGLEKFSRTTNLSECGVTYAVVAIMGPQSGGKSTLLNKLFQTDFRMMDADDGRNQTTQGIWTAKGIGIDPFTIAIDVEGSDSRERGQDGATFEKQSALFALAIADIVIINMWCHDIGRQHAANRPLLKAVFEAMIRLFRARKTTLLFVIRDQTKTPFERLEVSLREDIEKIWAEIRKPDAYKGTPLGDFFKVEITALPNYEIEEDKFNDKVDLLRQRFLHSISPGGLAGDRKDVQPASAFSLRVEKIWEIIKDNKDLDLPAMEEMVATYRCDRIAKETLSRLKLDEKWLAMGEALKSGPVSEFREKLSSILKNYLCQYDNEAKHFKESIRDDKRKELEKDALQVLYPAYADMLRHLRSSALEFVETRFTEEVMKRKTKADEFEASIDSIIKDTKDKFEKESRDISISEEWDASAARENLSSEIEKRKYKAEAKFKKVSKKGKEKLLTGIKGAIGWAGARLEAVAVNAAGSMIAAAAGQSLYNSDTTNDLAGETFDNSPDCENADDLEGESADDLEDES